MKVCADQKKLCSVKPTWCLNWHGRGLGAPSARHQEKPAGESFDTGTWRSLTIENGRRKKERRCDGHEYNPPGSSEGREGVPSSNTRGDWGKTNTNALTVIVRRKNINKVKLKGQDRVRSRRKREAMTENKTETRTYRCKAGSCRAATRGLTSEIEYMTAAGDEVHVCRETSY